MRLLSYLLVFTLFTGCVPDLPRNNPHDKEGSNFKPTRKLEYYSHEVTCKYPEGATRYVEENSVEPGDRIFLSIKMKNTGNVKLEGIRGNITTNSNIVEVKPIPNNYYLQFSKNSDKDYLEIGETGYGFFISKDGGSKPAPNYNPYAIEFEVYQSANSGDQINFQINANAKSGDSWEDSFTVTVQ